MEFDRAAGQVAGGRYSEQPVVRAFGKHDEVGFVTDRQIARPPAELGVTASRGTMPLVNEQAVFAPFCLLERRAPGGVNRDDRHVDVYTIEFVHLLPVTRAIVGEITVLVEIEVNLSPALLRLVHHKQRGVSRSVTHPHAAVQRGALVGRFGGDRRRPFGHELVVGGSVSHPAGPQPLHVENPRLEPEWDGDWVWWLRFVLIVLSPARARSRHHHDTCRCESPPRPTDQHDNAPMKTGEVKNRMDV